MTRRGKISILFFHSFFSFREKGLSDSRPVCPAGSLSLVRKFYRFFLVVSCELLVLVVKIFERNKRAGEKNSPVWKKWSAGPVAKLHQKERWQAQELSKKKSVMKFSSKK